MKNSEVLKLHIQRAVEHPTTFSALCRKGSKNFLEGDVYSEEEKNLAATVSLSLKKIISPESNNSREIEQILWETVQEHFNSLGQELPQTLVSLVQPQIPTNVIEHEVEHCLSLPQESQNDVRVEMTFFTDRENNLFLQGSSQIETSKLTVKQLAEFFSAPRSVSWLDAQLALYYAQCADDILFLTTIQQMLRRKPRH